MSYFIFYASRGKKNFSTTQRPTAREALDVARALQMSDEEIKFIDTPTQGRIDMDMLRALAKEEDERT
jgi:hypothetical protein